MATHLLVLALFLSCSSAQEAVSLLSHDTSPVTAHRQCLIPALISQGAVDLNYSVLWLEGPLRHVRCHTSGYLLKMQRPLQQHVTLQLPDESFTIRPRHSSEFNRSPTYRAGKCMKRARTRFQLACNLATCVKSEQRAFLPAFFISTSCAWQIGCCSHTHRAGRRGCGAGVSLLSAGQVPTVALRASGLNLRTLHVKLEISRFLYSPNELGGFLCFAVDFDDPVVDSNTPQCSVQAGGRECRELSAQPRLFLSSAPPRSTRLKTSAYGRSRGTFQRCFGH